MENAGTNDLKDKIDSEAIKSTIKDLLKSKFDENVIKEKVMKHADGKILDLTNNLQKLTEKMQSMGFDREKIVEKLKLLKDLSNNQGGMFQGIQGYRNLTYVAFIVAILIVLVLFGKSYCFRCD